MNSSYITSAQKANQLPNCEFPEVAFIGRSNCGKSSLLNTLLERKSLARSSSTPGRTQMVNFFGLSTHKSANMLFVDLPGYGYNLASSETQKLWDPLMAAYLERETIVDLICIIDCRRGLDDYETAYWRDLSEKVPIIVVMTKIDKLKQKDLQAKKKNLTAQLENCAIRFKGVYPVSNLKKSGTKELQKQLFAHMKQEANETTDQ